MLLAKRFNKNSIPQELKVLSNWPTINVNLITDEKFIVYDKREKAVRAFLVEDMSIDLLEKTFNIKRANFYRLLKRCLKEHKDGRIWGFRALVPSARLEKYIRTKTSTSKPAEQQGGSSGSLIKHFDQFPEMEEFFKDEFLQLVTDNNKLRENQIQVTRIHGEWINKLRARGFTAKDWPFTSDSLGVKSIEKHLKSLYSSHYEEAVKVRHGDEAAKKMRVGTGRSIKLLIKRLLKVVEFDGHKIDSIFAIKFLHPNGGEITQVLSRFQLLFIIDKTSRAILGYYICLRKEYSGEDVLRCVRNAIIRPKPRTLTIPGLKYPDHYEATFSRLSKTLHYACWNELHYDNAKANIAGWARTVLTRSLGFMINTGPAGFSDKRSIVERFFKTLEENGFWRLPSTTGSHGKDQKRKNPEKAAIEYEILIDHLYEILDVIVAKYNMSPHEGVLGRTPFEVLEYLGTDEDSLIRTIPEDMRHKINFLEKHIEVTVKGNVKKGIRPYINYKNARYTGPLLSISPEMIGQKIIITPNIDDMREAQAYHTDGIECDSLKAMGPFGEFAHDDKTRDVINKLIRQGRLTRAQMNDPIRALLDFYAKKAVKSKDAANEIARIKNADFYKDIPKSDEIEDSAESETLEAPEQLNDQNDPRKLNKKARVY